VDAAKREVLRREWNRPVLWPLVLVALLLLASLVPAVVAFRKRENMAARPSA
jgi:hypothetical protein